MLPCPKLLTPPSIPTPEYISHTSLQLLKSSLLLLQVNADSCMANPRERQNSQQWNIPLEIQSAYWANTNSSAPANPNASDDRRFLSVHQAAEAPYSNAGPVSSSSDMKKRNPAGLLSLIRRRSDTESSTLQPNSNVNPSSTSLSPYSYYPQHHSQSLEPLRSAPANLPAHRSMPSSPSHSTQPPPFSRAFSAHVQPTPPLEASPQRYSSLEAPAARTPRTSRTFPETQREAAAASLPPPPPSRPRRQTWLGPFDDASQFHLFVEATSGLPEDAGISPASPPGAAPTLFKRPTTAAPQPAPHSYYQHPPPQLQTPQYGAPAPPLPRTSSHRFAAELEQLEGDEEMPDEELPDYAQSQAEMNARRRTEAARRAAELERSWARARGRR